MRRFMTIERFRYAYVAYIFLYAAIAWLLAGAAAQQRGSVGARA